MTYSIGYMYESTSGRKAYFYLLKYSTCIRHCFHSVEYSQFQIKKICLNSFFNLFMFSSKSALGRVGGFRGSSADCLQLLRWFFKSGLKRKCHQNLSAGSSSGFEQQKSCLNFFLNLFTFSSKFDLARGEALPVSSSDRLQHV